MVWIKPTLGRNGDWIGDINRVMIWYANIDFMVISSASTRDNTQIPQQFYVFYGFLTYFSHYIVNQRLIGWWFRWTNMGAAGCFSGFRWIFPTCSPTWHAQFLGFFGPRFFHRRAETSLFGFIKKHLKKLCNPIAVWDTIGQLVGPFNVCLCFFIPNIIYMSDWMEVCSFHVPQKTYLTKIP